MPKFAIVRVHVSKSITLAARVPVEGDPAFDRETLACVRNQLRHYARTGQYVPTNSSEPPISDPEFGVRIARERRGATVTRKGARRG